MQTCYDRLMVRPSVNLLRQALDEALAAGNGDDPVLHVEAEDWNNAIGAARPLREGFREWSDVRYYGAVAVAMVWWTDHAGRRHFRVMAERWPGWSGLGPRDGMIARGHPPLWFASVGQCFRVRTGAGEGWRVVCPCGEAGEMRALAWMGTRCAACHDRAQEGSTVPVTVRPGRASREEAEIGTSALDVKQEDSAVVVRRRPEGEEVLRHPIPPPVEGFGPPVVRWLVSPDETALLVTNPEHVAYSLRDGVWEQAWVAWQTPEHATAVALAEGGAFAAAASLAELLIVDRHGEPAVVEQTDATTPGRAFVCRMAFQGTETLHRVVSEYRQWERPADTEEVTTWERGPDGWKVIRRLQIPSISQSWFSPDGMWLAATELGRPGVAIRCLVTGEALGEIACFLHLTVQGVRFLPGGEAIFSHGADAAHLPFRRVAVPPGEEADITPRLHPAVRVPWRLLLR